MQGNQERKRVSLSLIWLLLIVLVTFGTQSVAAQGSTSWTTPRTIPGFHHETEPPILIADQNRTVHAFTYQFVDEFSDEPARVIVYNQWSLNGGWTEPNDILLSPLGQARLLDVFLDDAGMMHLIFFGGDGDSAHIFYSKAPATDAGQATAWSEPVLIGPGAEDPESGAIASDDQGNLVVLFSGNRNGHGFYQISSSDNGDTWSRSEIIFPTFSDKLWPVYLKFLLTSSGRLHAVWSVNDQANHGQAIYFSSYDFGDNDWSDAIKLAETQGDLGTQAPSIIEYNGSLFAMYYNSNSGKQLFIRSGDDGRTWSEPIAPFPHVGLNGPGAFVIDSSGQLHFLWGQRVTLDVIGQLNGMWHSTWNELEDRWSPYETVVSGEKIIDHEGDTAFDPNTARPVVVQGNVLLVTWRTDRGSKGNGVWYSYAELATPELPVVPLPSVVARSEPTAAPTAVVIRQPEPTAVPEGDFFAPENIPSQSSDNPLTPVFISLGPALLLVSAIIIRQALARRHYR